MAVNQHVLTDAVGGKTQGQFAQRGKVAGAKEGILGGGGALGQIYFPAGQSGAQFIGREIHQLELRAGEGGVRHRFVDGGAGDLANRLGAAFDVLDVQRGEHIQAGVEQFHHVLPAFGMARFGGVGVGEFVHQHQLRPPAQRAVEIEFRELHAPVFAGAAGQQRQAFGEGVGFLAPVGFEVTDDDVAPGGEFPAGGGEHGVGLAHAGAHAEKDLEPAALCPRGFTLDRRQQRIGIGSVAFGHTVTLTHPAPNSASKRSPAPHPKSRTAAVPQTVPPAR